jgi:AraC-like DNA-binding protein
MRKDQLTPLLLEAKVLESLCLIAQDIQVSSKDLHTLVIPISRKRTITLNHQDLSLIHHLKEELVNDLSEHVHLKSYCKEHNISEQKLMHGFKHLYGQTISQYVQSERMTKGRIMILSSEYSVDQVSDLLGYSHPSNFVKAFKKHFNQTPHQYKKAYLSGELK